MIVKYYEFKADIDGQTDVIYGSYERADCVYELEAERPGLKEEGYKKFRIESRVILSGLERSGQLYKAGLISEIELQKEIDFVNMGSDTRFITIRDLVL